MYTDVSTDYKSAVLSSTREFKARVLVGSIEYDDKIIKDFSISGSLVSSDKFTFGDTVSSYLELNLILPEKTVISTMSLVKPYISLKVNDTFQEVPLGIFFIDNVEKTTRNLISIKAYDAMGSNQKLNKYYISSNLTFPTKAQSVLNEICEKNNLECITVLPDLDIKDFSILYNKSYREVVGMLACIYGGYARINRKGGLEFFKYTDSGYTYEKSNYGLNSLSKGEVKFTCNKIKCKLDNNEEIISGSGSDDNMIEISCPIMTQSILDSIMNHYNGYNFYPIKVDNLQGNPLFEAGDYLTIKDFYNESYVAYINILKLSYNGSVRTTIESKYTPTKKTPLKGSVKNRTATDNNAIHKGDDIPAGNITGTIPTDVLSVNIIQAVNADISSAVIDSAKIGNIDASQITSGSVSTAILLANVIEAINLSADTINADKIDTESLSAEIANIIDLNVENVKAQLIDVINLSAGTISSKVINTQELSADIAKIIELDANRITSNLIEVINLRAENVKIKSASIEDLSADKITTGDLNAERIKANVITAINASIGKINAEHVDVESIKTEILDAVEITAESIKGCVIEAINLNAGQAYIDKALINNVDAGSITSGTISSARIQGSVVEAINSYTGTATIDQAKIGELSASKISSGELNTGRVTIGSTSGTLKISNNTITIKDNQETPVTRVQLGEDAQGNYGIVVLNSEGTAIFDSQYGVLSTEGLIDGIISTDKIKDDAITTTKLNIDEIFANEAYIGKLNTMELNASVIHSGKLSSEFIDISGAVGFSSLDPNLQRNFIYDTNSNSTFIDGGSIYANTINANAINIKGYLNITNTAGTTTFKVDEDGNVEMSGLIKSDNYVEGHSGYCLRRNGDIEINSAVIRASIDAGRAGISNLGTGDNAVRFYAGGTIEDSPFIVYDDGRLVAKNATLGGTWSGIVNVGNIRIEDTTNSDGYIRILSNDDLETLINFQGYSESYITNSFSIGKDLNNIFLADPSSKKLELLNSCNLIAYNGIYNNSMNVLNGNNYDIMHISNTNNNTEYINTLTNTGAVNFNVKGNKNESYDFSFARNDGDANVKVNGNLYVTNNITGNSTIVARFMNDRLSFYAQS